MNRDEITAKIAELEKKIQMDKLQNAGADDAGKVAGRTQSGDMADSYALCLGGGGGKGGAAKISGCRGETGRNFLLQCQRSYAAKRDGR